MNDFYSILESHFSEIIGIVGVLLGVAFGAFVNKLSRWGRVKFYINEVRYYTSKQKSDGSITEIKTITSETKHLSINIDLDLLNTSEFSINIMRNINFLAVNKDYKKTVKVIDKSKRIPQNHLIKTEYLKNISLNPKEIRNLNLKVGFSEDAQKIVSSDWFLVYRNQKNGKRRVRIKKTTNEK